jgi:AraC-like DNA-binding protein
MTSGALRIGSQDERGTRLGRLQTTGFVDNGPALVPYPRRVLQSYALVLVHSGAGSYVDNETGPVPIEPGNVITVSPGHAHWYGPPPGGSWSEIFLIFDGPLFDALAAGGVLDARDPVRRVAPLKVWRDRVAELADRVRPSGTTARNRELLDLAALLVDMRGGGHDAEPLTRGLRQACNLLSGDLTGDLELRGVAAAAGLPYETFRKQFRAAVGTSPAAFRLDRRIEAAQALLRMTGMTHAAIAASLGFADEYHFAKRFRERVGVAPRDYRRIYATHRSARWGSELLGISQTNVIERMF